MKKILIVDDDAELSGNLTEILEDAGYQTDMAASGNEALEKVTDGFDVVMLDMIMPGMSGLEVISELKKLVPATKIIMITAFATVDNAVQAIKLGANDYISKPFLIDDLLVTVKKVLEEASFDVSNGKLDMDFALSSLSNPIRRQIIHFLDTRKKMRLMELTRELEIADHTKVIFHLKTLKEANIIDQGSDKSYFLTPEGYRVLGCLNILETHLKD
jgi:DNA-binding NtrC family response regulator